MGARIIVPNADVDEPLAPGRARTIPRTVHASTVLGSALQRCGVSARSLAEHWGVGRSYVQRVVDGVSPLSLGDDRLCRTPKIVLDAIADVIRDRGEERAFVPPPPESMARKLIVAVGRFTAALEDALPNGIDSVERATLLPLAGDVARCANAQLRSVERVGR